MAIMMTITKLIPECEIPTTSDEAKARWGQMTPPGWARANQVKANTLWQMWAPTDWRLLNWNQAHQLWEDLFGESKLGFAAKHEMMACPEVFAKYMFNEHNHPEEAIAASKLWEELFGDREPSASSAGPGPNYEIIEEHHPPSSGSVPKEPLAPDANILRQGKMDGGREARTC